ncbi:Crp/Fnr family transcriptional regulator [Motiliproteus sp. MSK22-1]|uniref:Crp/Fnr family transcriptional regulator n=1 Tax=Motiliproteus sp. MSK22-1 TaxID=1897630 RepID=UPI0013010BCB|nr:Crp/Fnr family transcriptional regulator [Motiliproteus sp. MSK22-1]
MISISLLKQINLLEELKQEELAYVAQHLQLVEHPRGATVVPKGSSPEALYFLFRGRLKVTNHDSNGREISLNFIDPGSHFGELGLIDGKPRSATIIATERSTVGALPKPLALRLIYHQPGVSRKLMQQLTAMVRAGNDHLLLLGQSSAYTRVYTWLLKIATQPEELGENRQSPTQQELAQMANTTRETVSRAISNLIKAGILEKSGKQLVLLDPQRLQQLSQQE